MTVFRRPLALAGALVAAKLAVLGLRALDHTSGPRLLARPGALFAEDAALVAVALGLELVTRRATSRIATRLKDALFWAVVVYTAFNVAIARTLGTPLTFALVRAAGTTLADSLRRYVTPTNTLGVAVVIGAAILGARLAPRLRPRAVAAFALALVTLGLLTREAAAESLGLHRNAVVTLARTAFQHHRGAAPAPSDLPPLAPSGRATDLAHLAGAGRGKSVVHVVLESTGARYLQPWGATGLDPMPRLSELARGAVLFDRAYAVHPESIKGMMAYLCAQAPAMDTDADHYAKLGGAALPALLARHGYHTALFHSGRFAYLGMRHLVDHRGFDTLADAAVVGGPYERSFGVDDRSTVDRALAWIDGHHDRPFYLVYMPIGGHHPYQAPGVGKRPFGEASDFDAYRSDLFQSDEALGALIDGLSARGLADDVVWVVHGDHGEAFQQHDGNVAHSLHVFEENLHVPLLVRIPKALEAPVHALQTASLLDVPRTIAAVLGVPADPRWDGGSLLEGTPRVARAFVDHVSRELAVIDGPWKAIVDLDRATVRLFRLDLDPGELHDLAKSDPARAARYRVHVEAWAARERARVLGAR
ncbi:MAG: sulfatase-like hydrolase/transferase [Myxococcales bacterium]|nr:sulfatase-like hydrolase/transferase [Myxococcales bacterium]